MISRGMRGDHVVNIQELLGATGLYQGQVNGVYDQRTESAVIKLQQANGLRPDGVWGPITNGHVLTTLDKLNQGSQTGTVTPLFAPNQEMPS